MGAPPREQGGSTRQRENGGPSPPHRSRAVPCWGQGLGFCTPCQLADCRLCVSASLLPEGKRLGGRLSFQQAVTVSVLSYPLSISLSGRCPLLVSRLYLGANQDLHFQGLHSLPRLWLLHWTISRVPRTEYLCPRFIC